MAAADILAVRDLAVAFASDAGLAQVLDRVNLTIRRGEVMGLVGESGCGKSTLARAVLGVLPENAARIGGGRVMFDGEDLLRIGPEEMSDRVRGRRITFIPQDPYGSFNPLFSVGDQVMEIMRWKSKRRPEGERGYPRARRAADRAEAIELLRQVQIPEPEAALSKLPHEFSGGQRQRLMIAMALLPQPDLIIADEPTTALDVTIQAQILRLLRKLVKGRGISVLFTTHDMGTAHEICDRITVLYAGQEMETAPVDAFFVRPAHQYTARLLDSLPNPDREIREIGGEIPRLIDPPQGCRFHPRCAAATDICRSQRPDERAVAAGHVVRCHHPHEGARHAA
ncbi:MAG: ABC transporter ATP-binding protein [Alphaproteobacteria bacterium]|nr:ABC transporter ATP-binding protein [Alphaproteobacteria bacterium]